MSTMIEQFNGTVNGTTPRLSITPGREEEFRCFQGWLAASSAIDRVIEATEPAESIAHEAEEELNVVSPACSEPLSSCTR